MLSNQSKASERGFDAMDSKQQKKISSKEGNATAAESIQNRTSKQVPNSGELSENAEKSRQYARRKGRQDWGGYQGY